MSDTAKKFFWRGKRVTEKVFKKRLQQQKIGKNIRNVYGIRNVVHNLKEDVDSKVINLEGRRIIHIETLREGLECKNCNFTLSLKDITEERKIGLASIFYIQCRMCKVISDVCTDKQHRVSNHRNHFNMNTKAVIGTLSAGMDNTHLNKLLSALNIPEFNLKSFKIHEKEVEKIAKEVEAANEERDN